MRRKRITFKTYKGVKTNIFITKVIIETRTSRQTEKRNPVKGLTNDHFY